MITPEEAQALLKGTTPAPWDVSRRENATDVARVEYDQGAPIFISPVAAPETKADAHLIARAPGMAKQIANMHQEYAVQILTTAGEWQNYGGWAWQAGGDYDMALLPPDDPQGWSTDYQAVCDAASESAADHTRIVRRVVGEPEVID